MIIAVCAWIIAAMVCYIFLRRTIYNIADPLVFDNIAIPFSAALLAVLCAADFISIQKLVLFALVLLGFLLGTRAATSFLGRGELRLAIIRTISRISLAEIYCILILTMLVTLLLTVLAVQAGGLGDGRADFNRSFRPLAIVRSGLFLFSLLVLLSPKLSSLKVVLWLSSLILLSIAFSGKGVFIPVFYWFGLKFFITSKRVSFVALASLASVTLLGSALMGIIAYGAASGADIAILIANRFWLYGDVYIYAYKLNALDFIRSDYNVSFLSYMFHPITSLFGVRGYEKPLGSMLMSAAIQSDVLAGPNPQLPVLLDFFFPNRLVIAISIAFVIGLGVFAIRVLGVRAERSRSRYIALGGVAAAVFCPGSGFVDTSQVLITSVGIGFVSLSGAVIALIAGPRHKPMRHDGMPRQLVPVQPSIK